MLETPEPLMTGTGVHTQALVSGTADCSDSTQQLCAQTLNAGVRDRSVEYSWWQGLSVSFLVDEKLLEGNESSDRLLCLAVHP